MVNRLSETYMNSKGEASETDLLFCSSKPFVRRLQAHERQSKLVGISILQQYQSQGNEAAANLFTPVQSNFQFESRMSLHFVACLQAYTAGMHEQFGKIHFLAFSGLR